jgi:hypothetical protein
MSKTVDGKMAPLGKSKQCGSSYFVNQLFEIDSLVVSCWP